MSNTRSSNKKEKMSTSKKGLVIIFCVAILLTAILVVLTVKGPYELSVLGEVCTSLWAAVGAYSAFYLWKSKVENKAKYSQAFLDQMADKYGIENIIPLLQSIIED